jgi:hypothetical protein
VRLVLALSLLLTPVAVAAQGMEVPSVVPTFAKLCLIGGLDPAARVAALKANGWAKDNIVTVDVPRLGISKAIERNYDFSKPETTEQWANMVDGRAVKIVLARFPAKRRHNNLCALTVDGIQNAMPYGRELREAFKTFGIGGKSVDLAHYYEFAGKVGAEKKPVRGEVFSRSLASGGNNSMHIYVAY